MIDVIKRNNVSVIEGNGPTILFAHGFGCDQNMWSRLTPLLADNYRQVLFDYVGSGQSELSAYNVERYSSIEGYAQDIIDVCQALSLEKVIFVGHSVSCSAGIVAANRHPELIEKLILVGPSPCFLNLLPEYAGGFNKADLEELLALMEQNYVGWANYLAPVVAGASGEGQISGELADSFCSTDPIVARTFAQTTFFADKRGDFEANVLPSLILQHKNDTLAPLSVGEYIKTVTKNGVYEVLDVNGHCAHMSHPKLVSDAIIRYLANDPV